MAYTDSRSKDSRRYIKGKQGKTDDIKRALIHRARLRKNYFKLLENEGEDVPAKPTYERDGGRSYTKEYSTEERKEKEEKNDGSLDEPPRKPLTFQERMEIKKERKQRQRQEKLEKTRLNLKTMKEKEHQRKKNTESLKDSRTRKGQPLMGPRINNLLDKIKKGL